MALGKKKQEHPGVWVRDSDRKRAASRARIVATRLGYTLYLGRDVRNGDWIACSRTVSRIPYKDRHYGDHPIVPVDHYWEATLIAEGRAVWI